MSRTPFPAPVPALILAVSLAAGGLAGCQALGSTNGVMPDTDVGLPPSMRGAIPGRQARTATLDDDGRPLPAAPTRNIDIPKSAGAASRSADASERRIRRDELEGSDARSGSSSNGMAPSLTPGGSVGLGGKF
ncbi:hypothetical protein [Methylobacterium sp. J-067]|uniref:hypothetical protein n=1 Tax=Methylobacterium sp. J-067 TaxID=2836648 RepID=UPI001FBBD3FF|nr:hypothetical protein [Methylobacterium sp. J-067]MCJ2027474.1 hypothetical protein [Methylobacterium sp. J-067]